MTFEDVKKQLEEAGFKPALNTDGDHLQYNNGDDVTIIYKRGSRNIFVLSSYYVSDVSTAFDVVDILSDIKKEFT